MELSKIGQSIRKSRKHAKLTQQELAQLIGKTESSIRKYEKGLVQIPIDVVDKIAAALNVSIIQLMPELTGLDYLDKKASKEYQDYDAFEGYLSKLGYSITTEKIRESESGHWEEQKDGDVIVGRSFIPDEEFYEIKLTKEGKSVSFSTKEFNELQGATKDVIETRFYKKIMEARTKPPI